MLKKTLSMKQTSNGIRVMAAKFKSGIAASVIAVAIATVGTTAVTSLTFAPEAQAWSIKSAAKKAVKAGKSVGRNASRVVRGVNRVIVPSEIRNGASNAKRLVSKAGRYVVKHPYGKRCQPGKYLLPSCKVGSTRTKVNVHDHRTKVNVPPRRTKINVHDHRTKVNVHDHRTTRTN